MANKYTAHPLPNKGILETLYHNKNMTQTEIAEYLSVSQKMVFGWFRKLNIKARIAVKRNQIGKNNHSWKGDNAGYAAFHYRVISQRGSPQKCEYCKTKTAKRYEWANLTGKYKDITDYIRLCCSCHRKLDRGTKQKINIRWTI